MSERIEFDPNDMKSTPFASYIPGRRPEFKLHLKRGQATATVVSHRRGLVFAFKDGRWEEIGRADGPRKTVCDACGADFLYYTYSGWRRSRGKIVEPLEFLTVCANCRGLVR